MAVISAETKRITELPTTAELHDDDMLIVELSDGGTRRMSYGDLLTHVKSSIGYDTVEVMKREALCLDGSTTLGVEFDLDTLMEYVKAGQYSKFAIGDYIVDNSIQWVIVAKRWYKGWNFGDGVAMPEHIVCMPYGWLPTMYAFNATDTNAGGYAGSSMPTNMETEFAKLSAKLQNYCKQTRIYEDNKNAWAAAMRKMRLPTIVEVTGTFGWATDGHVNGVTSQLPLLKNTQFKNRGISYWCVNPATPDNKSFCVIDASGASMLFSASTVQYVRPLITLA